MEYLTANSYFRSIFGKKVIKLSINCGFSCPNRDGTLSDKGCIFCSGKGSGDFAPSHLLSVNEQIDGMKKMMQKKWRDGAYMVYFQAYTNTYAPIEVLRQKYFEAAEREDISAVSIATRPDCVGDDVIQLLKELNGKTRVFVELGLQTSNKNTAQLINRCYENEVYEQTMRKLRECGINVITHMIIGLPGENKKDWLETAKFAADNKTDGIKIQLLHIIKGTEIEKMYRNGTLKPLEFDEYIDGVCESIRVLPPSTVIHRMTGDGARKDLIAPLWSTDKKRVLNTIRKSLKSMGITLRDQ